MMFIQFLAIFIFLVAYLNIGRLLLSTEKNWDEIPLQPREENEFRKLVFKLMPFFLSWASPFRAFLALLEDFIPRASFRVSVLGLAMTQLTFIPVSLAFFLILQIQPAFMVFAEFCVFILVRLFYVRKTAGELGSFWLLTGILLFIEFALRPLGMVFSEEQPAFFWFWLTRNDVGIVILALVVGGAVAHLFRYLFKFDWVLPLFCLLLVANYQMSMTVAVTLLCADRISFQVYSYWLLRPSSLQNDKKISMLEYLVPHRQSYLIVSVLTILAFLILVLIFQSYLTTGPQPQDRVFELNLIALGLCLSLWTVLMGWGHYICRQQA